MLIAAIKIQSLEGVSRQAARKGKERRTLTACRYKSRLTHRSQGTKKEMSGESWEVAVH